MVDVVNLEMVVVCSWGCVVVFVNFCLIGSVGVVMCKVKWYYMFYIR